MNINIIAVGKIKERYIRDGINEFSKRLGRYCNLNIIEVLDEATPDNASKKEEELIKEIEGKRILKKLPNKGYVISLVIEGREVSSIGLAKTINNMMVNGVNDLTFIIGGSLGLSTEVMEKSDFKISFSKLTFPHQIMRLILTEQVYRSFRIIRGEPYHK